jgi:hypothetical protein
MMAANRAQLPPTACNKLEVKIRGGSARGGSQQVANPITTTWHLREEVCIFFYSAMVLKFRENKRDAIVAASKTLA